MKRRPEDGGKYLSDSLFVGWVVVVGGGQKRPEKTPRVNLGANRDRQRRINIEELVGSCYIERNSVCLPRCLGWEFLNAPW